MSVLPLLSAFRMDSKISSSLMWRVGEAYRLRATRFRPQEIAEQLRDETIRKDPHQRSYMMQGAAAQPDVSTRLRNLAVLAQMNEEEETESYYDDWRGALRVSGTVTQAPYKKRYNMPGFPS